MTRLAHLFTTLAAAAALLPAAAGTTFAQDVRTNVQVETPFDFHFDLDMSQFDMSQFKELEKFKDFDKFKDFEQLKDLKDFNGFKDLKDLKDFEKFKDFDKLKDLSRMAMDMAEVGRVAQDAVSPQQREQIERMADQAREMAEHGREMAERARVQVNRAMRHCDDRDADRLYDCGRDALDNKEWDHAIDYFGRVAAAKGERADAALYWKAYAQNKLGQRPEALATIAEFKAGYAKSRWANDVNALEVDVRQKSGQPIKPGDTTDDDTKLLVLQNLMGNSSAEVVPLLEKLVTGPQSPKVKDRALFVLAQSPDPNARLIVVKVAKGGANPELQARAVRYLAEMNAPESRQALAEVYASTADVDVKRNVLRGYMQMNDKDHLLTAAKSETNPELRLEAIRSLGNMRADDGLAELYGKETSADVKKAIIRALANGGDADKLMSLAQTEPNAELRRSAVRSLGIMRKTETGPKLVTLYDKEQNVDVRKAVIDALFIQNNATALVSLAKKEQNADLKQELVRKLAVMKDKEATDYLIGLLK